MCPSEVSDIDDSIYAEYASKGVQVWAISADPKEALEDFRDQLDIDMPILMDPGEQALQQYRQVSAFPTGAYPHDFVVGRDGTLIYTNNRFDHGAMTDAIESELD